MTHISLASTCLLLLTACPLETPNGQDEPDAGPPPVQYTVGGTYDASGSWDVSGPFTATDGIGGVVADVIIEKIVGAAGVPSSLEDEAIGWVSDHIRAPVRDFVNGQLPPTLQPGGDVMNDLAAVFAQVDVTSTFELTDTGQDSFTGTQRYTSFAMTHQGQTRTVTAAELLDDVGVSIAATTAGSRQALVLSVDPRPVQVRFGKLVSIAGEDLLAIDIDALTAQAAIDCSGVLNTITGGAPDYVISVGGQTFTVGASSITSACNSLAQSMAEKVLGLFTEDTPIELGGTVIASDSDGDHAADALQSGPDYGGEIIVSPRPLSPQVAERFTATR